MTDNDDAYRPPKVNLEVPLKTKEAILREPRRCPLSAGGYWIRDAWHIFKLRPWLLIGMWGIFFLIMATLSALPLISIFTAILTPVFTAGFAFSAAKVERNEIVSMEDLFAGFSRNLSTLLGIGGLSLIFAIVAIMLAVLLAVLLLGIDTMGTLFSERTGEEFIKDNLLDKNINILVLLSILIYCALQIPLMMLTWFAPVLIIRHDVNVWQAMALSFKGCLRNMLPFFVFSLIFLGLFIIALIPLFLGLLVVAPLFMLTFYTAYKDIYLHTDIYEASFIA